MKKKVTRNPSRPGVTLMELVVTLAIGLIIVLTVSTVLYMGQRQWVRAYYNANIGIQMDALQTMVTFGSMGRRSNKTDYVVYSVAGGTLTRVTPPLGEPVSVVTGEAVEFRFWDTELTADLMDSKKTGTAYALFYLDDTTLKVDLGPYDSTTKTGGVDSGGRRTTGSGVRTRTVAENVTALTFSHTTRNADGDGDGCVRMEAVFTDPCDNGNITIKTATLMRNVWP